MLSPESRDSLENYPRPKCGRSKSRLTRGSRLALQLRSVEGHLNLSMCEQRCQNLVLRGRSTMDRRNTIVPSHGVGPKKACVARAIPSSCWQTRGAPGSIVIMSSLGGLFGYTNRRAYRTAKMGLMGFAKTLSRGLASSIFPSTSLRRGPWPVTVMDVFFRIALVPSMKRRKKKERPP